MGNILKRFLLLLICGISFIFSVHGKKLPIFTERKNLDSLKIDSFASVTNDLITKGSYPTSTSWTTGFCYKSAEGRVILGLKSYFDICPPDSFELKVKFRINFMNEVNHVDSADTTLTVTYNKISGDHYNEKSYYISDHTHYLTAKIISISDTSLRKYAYIETQIEEDRIYSGFLTNMIPIVTSVNYISGTDEIEIVLSDTLISKVDAYELEWTFNDGYHRDSLNAILPKSAVPYDFRQNATRIMITSNRYRISNVFEKGYLLVRARALSYTCDNLEQLIQGNWSLSSNSRLDSAYSLSPLACITIGNGTIPAHEPDLVWQYAVSYAEEGKKKEQIAYYDGILKNRQNVTKGNTDSVSIAGETIYDYEGRPAIQVLPVPTFENILKYYHSFNRDTIGNEYSYNDFDLSTDCQSITYKMDTISGASKYYSTNNSWLSYSGSNIQKDIAAFIPCASGYPFTQTEYTADHTGRVKRQGGVGINHQLGSGHETQYFYATPFQEELDRLFGNEVGIFTHYKKNMIIDPNGQVSVSYTDSKGHVIATAMAGETPLSNSALSSNQLISGIVADLRSESDTLMVENSIIVSKSIVVPDNGTNYGFAYSVEPEKYFPTCNRGSACYDCVYDLEISLVKDCDGEIFIGGGDTIKVLKRIIGHGVSNIDTAENNSSYTYSFATDSRLSTTSNYLELVLDKGKYTLVKTLSVNQEAYQYYLNDYLTNRACKTIDEFESAAWQDLDTNTCEMTCESCHAYLGSDTAYMTNQLLIITNHGMTPQASDSARIIDEYAMFSERCNQYCQKPTNACDALLDILKGDVRPGGQYAEYTYNEDSLYFEPLLTRGTFNFLNGSTENNFTTTYKNHSYFKTDSTFVNGELMAYSDMTPDQFIHNWRDTFADIFVVYHPEYCKYKRCLLDSSSANFDIAFMGVETYQEASDSGYLDPVGVYSSPIVDPFFKTGGFGNSVVSLFKDSLSQYKLFFTDTFLTIWDVAVNNLFCSQIEDNRDHYNCIVTYRDSIDNCISFKNYYWQTFRSLYYAAKQRTIKRLRDLWSYDGMVCSDARIPGNYTHTYDSDSSKYHVSIPDEMKHGSDMDEAYANSKSDFDTSCIKQCHAYREIWRDNLKGCNISSASMEILLDSLEEVCRLGCDQFNPMGSSTIAFRYTANPVSLGGIKLKSFKDVIKNIRDTNFFVEGLCDDLLITMPKPYGHDFFSSDAIYSDTCACDSSSYNYPLGRKWPCRDTITVANNKCPCESQNSGITKQVKNMLNVLEDQAPQYKCKSCIGCEQFRRTFESFNYNYKELNDSTQLFKEIFTTWFNNHLGFNLFFEDYMTFAASCADTTYSSNYHNVIRAFKNTYWITDTDNPFGMQLGYRSNQKKVLPFQQEEQKIYVAINQPKIEGNTNLDPIMFLKNKIQYDSTKFQLSALHYLNEEVSKNEQKFDNTTASIIPQYIFKTESRMGINSIMRTMVDAQDGIDTCGCDKVLMAVKLYNEKKAEYPFIKSASQFFAGSYNYYKELPGFDSLARMCCKALTGDSAVINYSDSPCTLPSEWGPGQWTMSVIGGSQTKRYQTLEFSKENNPIGQPILPFMKCDFDCGRDLDKCGCDAILKYYKQYQIDSTGGGPSFKSYFNTHTGYLLDSIGPMMDMCLWAFELSQGENPGDPYPDSAVWTSSSQNMLKSLLRMAPFSIPPGLSCVPCTSGSEPYKAILGCKDIMDRIENAAKDLEDSALFDYNYIDTAGHSLPLGLLPYFKYKYDSLGGGYEAYAIVRALQTDSLYNVFLHAKLYEDSIISTLNDSFGQAPFFNHFNNFEELLDFLDAKGCLCLYGDSSSIPPLIRAYLRNYYSPTLYRKKMQCEVGAGEISPFVATDCNSCYIPNGVMWLIQNYLDTIVHNDRILGSGGIINKMSRSFWHLYPDYRRYYQTNLYYGGTSASTLKYNIVDYVDETKLTMRMYDTLGHSRKVILYFSDLGKYGNFLTIRSFFGIRPKISENCDTVKNRFTIFASYQKDPGKSTSAFDTIMLTGETSDWEIIKTISCCLKLCNKSIKLPDDTLNQCKERMKRVAYLNATQAYDRYMDSLAFAFKIDYFKKCMRKAASTEHFTMKYDERQYHYTLYYYDQAGNLVRTVPPAGVVPITDTSYLSSLKSKRIANDTAIVRPVHVLTTAYSYNSLNAITGQLTPDEGTSAFYYDAIGRLIISQNAKQVTVQKYSYTKYDALGRIAEVGQIKQTTAPDSTVLNDTANYRIWLGSNLEQITNTFYDNPNYTIVDTLRFNPINLRSRVVYSTYKEYNGTGYDQAVHYSYDLHGNVREILRETPALASIGQDYKITSYDFDLVSGKVNKVTYQKDEMDQYVHNYEYDADNRLTKVYSGHTDELLDKDAGYYYYLHGPLARTELGKLQVQGIDYAYTIQGWLKGVNAGTINKYRDMGGDGKSGTNQYFSQDVFGFVLNYFGGDYNPIGTTSFAPDVISASLNSQSPNLFNGNIRMMDVAIKQFGNTPIAYAYKYDQLNRIAEMNAYTNYDSSNNKWSTTGSPINDYHNRFTYDANGNIITQVRRGYGGTLALDSLGYEYYASTNRLKRVTDGVNNGNYPDDIDNQNDTNNYKYDAIGNLTRDIAEEIDTIFWNVYGKISRIKRTPTSTKPDIEFQYTPDGHRALKIVIPKVANLYRTYTYYSRDAQGNILATYTRNYSRIIDYNNINYSNINDTLVNVVGLSSFGDFITSKYDGDPIADALLSSAESASMETTILDNFTLYDFMNIDLVTNLGLVIDNYDESTLLSVTQDYLSTNNLYNSFLRYLCDTGQDITNFYLDNYPSDYYLALNDADGNEFLNMANFLVPYIPAYTNFEDARDALLASSNRTDVRNYLETSWPGYTNCSTRMDIVTLEGNNGPINAFLATINDFNAYVKDYFFSNSLGTKLYDAFKANDANYLRSTIYSVIDQDTMLTWYRNNERSYFINYSAREIQDSVANWQQPNVTHTMQQYFGYINNYFGQVTYDNILSKYYMASRSYMDSLTLSDWQIYGSSRLGIYQTNLNLVTVKFNADTSSGGITNMSDSSAYFASESYTMQYLQRGRKRYEMVNHLSNVLTVISDKRLPVCSTGVVQNYTADIVSATDYAPFGAPLPGRTYNVQETQNKTTIASQDFASGTDSWAVTGSSTSVSNSSGRLALTTTNTTTAVSMSKSYTVNTTKHYRLSVDVDAGSVTGATISILGISSTLSTGTFTGASHQQIDFIADGGSMSIKIALPIGSGTRVVYIDNVKLEEVKGDLSGYIYGMNGQMKDDDINNVSGSHYTALYWEYDARTCRRWNIDPELKTEEGSYTTFSCNPIWFSDPLGNVAGDYYSKNGQHLGSDGKTDDKVYTADNVTKNDKGLVVDATNKNEINIGNKELNVRATLTVLKAHEGGKGEGAYNKWYGNSTFTDAQMAKGHPGLSPSGRQAAGAYQTQLGSWNDKAYGTKLRNKYDIKDFTPMSQDRFTVATIKDKSHRLGMIMNGGFKDALPRLADEWRALPGPNTQNKGFTVDDAVNEYTKAISNELGGKSDIKTPQGQLLIGF